MKPRCKIHDEEYNYPYVCNKCEIERLTKELEYWKRKDEEERSEINRED